MRLIRIESIGQPFTRSPGSASLAFQLVARAETMGLLPDGVEGPTRLDAELLRRLAGKLRSAGVATVQANRLETARGKQLERALREALDAVEASPHPQGEWAPARALLGDNLLAVLVGGISPSSLRRYAAGERETPDEVAWRLHVIARILGALRGSYNAYGIRRWFERRRSALGGKTPGRCLVEADSEDDPGLQQVIRLAEALFGVGAGT